MRLLHSYPAGAHRRPVPHAQHRWQVHYFLLSGRSSMLPLALLFRPPHFALPLKREVLLIGLPAVHSHHQRTPKALSRSSSAWGSKGDG